MAKSVFTFMSFSVCIFDLFVHLRQKELHENKARTKNDVRLRARVGATHSNSKMVCQRRNESERHHGSKDEEQIRVCARDMPTAKAEHLRLRAIYYRRCSATSSTDWMVRVKVCLVWIVSLLGSAELMQFIYFSRKKETEEKTIPLCSLVSVV